jgi:predicted negative regulator of RcsB-dependent stress response
MMQQQWPAATVLLDAVTGIPFLAEKSFLLGNIAESQGDKATAKSQYATVLQQKNSPLNVIAQQYLERMAEPDPRDKV